MFIYLAVPGLTCSRGIFSCSLWDLVLWPGIKLGPYQGDPCISYVSNIIVHAQHYPVAPRSSFEGAWNCLGQSDFFWASLLLWAIACCIIQGFCVGLFKAFLEMHAVGSSVVKRRLNAGLWMLGSPDMKPLSNFPLSTRWQEGNHHNRVKARDGGLPALPCSTVSICL